MQALVVIPTYNEQDNIKDLINQIFDLNLDINVLVIDDNSSDATGEIIDEIRKKQPRLSVIHRFDKRGRGLAGIVAFKYAIKQNTDYIIEMDADFSHSPEYIPVFLHEIKECDVVIGSRMIKGGSIMGRNKVRNIFSYFGQGFIKLILNLRLRDSTSGFRCFRRCCLLSVDWDKLISHGPSIIAETNFYFRKYGMRIKEVPIKFKERRGGRSKLNVFKILDAFFILIRLRLFYG